MRPQDQNIALAEFCGWQITNHYQVKGVCGYGPDEIRSNAPVDQQESPIPDFVNDKDAMLMVIQSMTPAQQVRYAGNLQTIIDAGTFMLAAEPKQERRR